MKKSISRNFIYRIILMFYQTVIPILIFPYIYRIFSPVLVGKIEFSYSIMNIFMVFSGFGVYTYGLRELSRIRDDKKESNKLFNELFLISLISVVSVLIVYFIFIYFSTLDKELKIFLLINSITLFSFIFYIDWMNESFENYGFITKKNMITRTLSVGSIFLFVKTSKDIYIYLLIIALANFISNFWSYIYIKKHIKFDFKNLELKKYLLPLGMILFISNINIMYNILDKTFLGSYSNASEVAYYSIGQKIMVVIYMIVSSIVTVSIPRLSYFLGSSKEKYENLLNKIITCMFLLIFPMSIGIVILSKEIVVFFSGSKYIIASSTIAVFGIRIVVIGIGNILSNQIMLLNKKEKQMVIIMGFAGIINLIMKLGLINGIFNYNFNSISAIITTMITEIIMIIINLTYIHKRLNYEIKIFKIKNLKYGFISLGFIPIAFVIKKYNLGYFYNVLIIFTLCSFYYLTILFLLKDKEFLNLLPNKLKNNLLKYYKI